ncbi:MULTISPECIES: hypothetical protein [Sorangium]|uniref:PEGA domain-containing protein n=1 Tax=Sorangium cellulosum TaxID=56 RepID=A0A4V0NHP0_SORCE|nr:MULTISPECIES: hypothetical protein [Sorangium]AUX37342.1 hypothetical protein SOCE836_095650 [Sorangium cellulosum]WCQ96631.1 hypothetical protein NQZ70_09418 [Sorangium sp. Soce836]
MRASIPLVLPRQAATLALVLASAFPVQAAAADPPPRSREVQELIDEAEKAAKRLELARARELWARVNVLEPSTMAVCQLGVFDLRLDRLEEAAAELTTCVARMPAPTSDIERRRYEVRRADLAAVRQRVAELHVSAPPGTARLLVDGRDVSAGRPVFVVPGQHEVTATGKQGQVARALVKVTAGQSRRVALAFEAPKAASAPAQARNPWTIGAGAAASAALLGAGAGLHLAGDAAESETAAKVSRLSDGSMLPSSAQFRKTYDEAHAANTRAGLFHGFGSAALVVGAAVGAATVAYVVWPRKAEIRTSGAGAEVKLVW